MIRAEARATLWQWREVIWALLLAALGLWLIGLGGLILIPLGGAVLALAAGLALLAWRRMRFAQPGTAPGMVEVDEGQISYYGPSFGGFVALPELAEVRLLTRAGHRFWRLRQGDGQVMLIPVAATGADRLFDAFAALPGMDTQALIAALHPVGRAQGQGLALVQDSLGPVIWRRPLLRVAAG